MSSHREAPEISKDPVADNTDTYAFVSPDKPSTVTIITNYLPAEGPAGGPNFYEFGTDVLYYIYVDNDADGMPEITYEFKFETTLRNPNTFLYNVGPISSLDDSNWNKRQFYTVTRIDNGARKVLGRGLKCPPCNIGPRSTPHYEKLGREAVHTLAGGVKVFAGQRNDPFYVDLGSIFDLGDLRPFQNLHLIPTPAAPGKDGLSTSNVHSIAIQVPIHMLTSDGSVPRDPMSAKAVLGIWGAASRRKVRITDLANDERAESGPWVQVSRLGNPLFNEVIVPLGLKDKWNGSQPVNDEDYAGFAKQPELAGLLPVLYPGVFPNLKALSAARNDIAAVYLTGIPAGIVPGFQNTTGSVLADMLRLNVAIPPSRNPNPLGLVAGDAAGWPNGRRVGDDVTTVAIRAVAGLTYPLVDPNKGKPNAFKPDAVASLVTQGLKPNGFRSQSTFPYVGTPHDGYAAPSTTS
jgi:hypothetical protein